MTGGMGNVSGAGYVGDGPMLYPQSPRRKHNSQDQLTHIYRAQGFPVVGLKDDIGKLCQSEKLCKVHGAGFIHADIVQSALLPYDPWWPHEQRYPRFCHTMEGYTSAWANAWMCGVREPEWAFWKELQVPKHRSGRCWLQMSGVHWSCKDSAHVGLYAFSIVVKVVTPMTVAQSELKTYQTIVERLSTKIRALLEPEAAAEYALERQLFSAHVIDSPYQF